MNIRNFVIISHVDHGKSTLADRFLEITGAVPKRLLRPQHLDRLESERERGITIKMAPVRMTWNGYILNLIDTPGHSDFSYEVERALRAVEGAVLLIDATQGVQAQTLANLEKARQAGLVVIGAVNKIDLNPPELAAVIIEAAALLGVDQEEIFKISGKTGAGVPELLRALTQKIPPPRPDSAAGPVLIFDSFYDEHRGIIASVRLFSGRLTGEVGYFMPELKPAKDLRAGEIGYVVTGSREPAAVKIGGDTISRPDPVVFVSFYPENGNDYEKLEQALAKLTLNDAALAFLPDESELLGRGFRGGFLGQLHFEITAERLDKEFKIKTVHGFPSVNYQFGGKEEILEPMVKIQILTPPSFLGGIFSLKNIFRLSGLETTTMGEKILISARLPLADLISDFNDKLKSVSAGYGSMSYTLAGYEPAALEKLEILLAGHLVPGLSRILPKEKIQREARLAVERLKRFLPRREFAQAIQAAVRGKIIARETIPALRKDVTGYLYGGDRSRKMKLWKKQKAGKARLKALAEKTPIKIPAGVFKEMLKK